MNSNVLKCTFDHVITNTFFHPVSIDTITMAHVSQSCVPNIKDHRISALLQLLHVRLLLTIKGLRQSTSAPLAISCSASSTFP